MNYGSFPRKRLERALKDRNSEYNSKVVYQYRYNGTLVAKYPSLHEAERSLGIKQDKISKACRQKGGHKTLSGFIWSFIPLSITEIKKLLFYVPKSIVQLTLDGKFVRRFVTIKEAARAMDCNANGISLCCRGLQNSCKGFSWKFECDYED